MSSDAKLWQDDKGWHGICDQCDEEIEGTNYDLVKILEEVENRMGQSLHWEIFVFGNGLGLRGYRAKSEFQ